MKPIVHKNRVYLPFKTKVDKLKSGDRFRKNERSRAVFTVIGETRMGFACKNSSGQTYYFSKGYPVIHMF